MKLKKILGITGLAVASTVALAACGAGGHQLAGGAVFPAAAGSVLHGGDFYLCPLHARALPGAGHAAGTACCGALE